MTIRPLAQADLPALQDMLTTIELFPPEMLPDLAGPVLDGDPHHMLLVADQAGVAVGLAYLRAEEMTEGVWNMLALGVAATVHRAGHGRGLVAEAEQTVRDRGARLMVVETSALAAFAGARAFYAAQGYAEVARIPDFWAPGDAKVVFTKAL